MSRQQQQASKLMSLYVVERLARKNQGLVAYFTKRQMYKSAEQDHTQQQQQQQEKQQHTNNNKEQGTL